MEYQNGLYRDYRIRIRNGNMDEVDIFDFKAVREYQQKWKVLFQKYGASNIVFLPRVKFSTDFIVALIASKTLIERIYKYGTDHEIDMIMCTDQRPDEYLKSRLPHFFRERKRAKFLVLKSVFDIGIRSNIQKVVKRIYIKKQHKIVEFSKLNKLKISVQKKEVIHE